MALQKPAGTWTYEDLFDLPEDRRFEIIDGELYEMPAPNLDHAATIIKLIAALLPVVTALGGKIYTAPVDVFIPGGNPVQPDIMVLLRDIFAKSHKRGIEGAPDLVVEVLSPSNPEHDRIRKRTLYARAGIPEYWIVSPEAGSVEVLRLVDGGYETLCRVAGNEVVASSIFPELTLRANQIVDSPLSSLQ